MAFYGPCIACQYGQHSEHVDVPQPVPEGVMGGHVCLCRGECRNREKMVGVRVDRDPAEEAKMQAVLDFLKGYENV